MFNQSFLHVKQQVKRDSNGDPNVKNGQEVTMYIPSKVISGLLTRRRRITHREDESAFESIYRHNARLNPDEITAKELNGGDLLILIDQNEVEIIQAGLLMSTENNEVLIDQDGNLQIVLGSTIITKNKENELPFFIQTIYNQIDPNHNYIWYVRCEIRRNNTSMYV